MRRSGILILLLFSLTIAWHYWIVKSIQSSDSLFTQMLYLPSGKVLRPVSFGYDLMLADTVFLWSIQYYGDPGFHPRLEYLRHTYDIITDLDPHFLDAYQTGALFMFYEGRNPKSGLELLEKGLEKNPTEWILAVDAGYYCMMNLKNYRLAADYFQKATEIPGVPHQAKRMVAAMLFRAGDHVTAYRLWREIYETSTKASIKQIAYHHQHDLKILIDLEALRKAVAEYKAKSGRVPLNLDQLVASGLIPEVPVDPEGDPYLYDAGSGEVSSKAQISLYKRYR